MKPDMVSSRQMMLIVHISYEVSGTSDNATNRSTFFQPAE
jgi:hypothetical protein